MSVHFLSHVQVRGSLELGDSQQGMSRWCNFDAHEVPVKHNDGALNLPHHS